MNKEQLQDAIEQEWSNMHHNASISRYYPDFRNEYESELFWNMIGDSVSMWIEDLQYKIKEEFGEELTFYSYGRMGATIAPHQYMRTVACNGFGGLKYEVDNGLDGYRDGLRVLKMFKYINEYWEDTAKHIPEWWKDTKEANEYEENIIAHDGKRSVMREVWI